MQPFIAIAEPGHKDQAFRQMSDTVYNVVLTANSATSVTIPSKANKVVIASTANVYVSLNGTAAVPSSNVLDGTGSVLNPTGFGFRPTDSTISLISPTACIVSLEFYS